MWFTVIRLNVQGNSSPIVSQGGEGVDETPLGFHLVTIFRKHFMFILLQS